MTFRVLVWTYVGAGAGLLATSLVTGRRATLASGEPHYLLTRTTILVEAPPPPSTQASDEALDRLFAEGGEPILLHVERPMFVLGLADATIPFIGIGGLLLGIAALVRAGARRRSEAGP